MCKFAQLPFPGSAFAQFGSYRWHWSFVLTRLLFVPAPSWPGLLPCLGPFLPPRFCPGHPPHARLPGMYVTAVINPWRPVHGGCRVVTWFCFGWILEFFPADQECVAPRDDTNSSQLPCLNSYWLCLYQNLFTWPNIPYLHFISVHSRGGSKIAKWFRAWGLTTTPQWQTKRYHIADHSSKLIFWQIFREEVLKNGCKVKAVAAK